MAESYITPTSAMLAAYVAASRGTQGTATTIDPALMQPRRLNFRQRLAILIAGADAGSVLFGPQQPLQPQAQSLDAAAIGRPWDYPMGWNTRVTPRTGEAIGFKELKNLAAYDVLRIIIERVKEEITSQDWTIGPQDKKATRDARSDEVAAFLEYPDKEHNWSDWLKMLLEQMLVYDAPAIWLRPTRGGDLYGLEIIDGSLISPKIMADGRLPPPEIGPAYQQVLKGLPAVDYIKPVRVGQPVPVNPNDGQPFPQLLYKPRNPRVDSVYGYGPIEQMITTIEIGLAREESLKSYYRDGSRPDTIFGVPDSWNPDQIAMFQRNFNAVLAGNLRELRQTQFVPGGFQPFDMKERVLTDQTDDYLIRLLCFCLGISPMPFVKMMNRATGETHQEQQKEEGILPHLQWVRNLMNFIIEWSFGYKDVVFRWEEPDSTDPLEQAQRYKIYSDAKVYHPDEIRQKLGDDAMPANLREQMDEPTFSNAVNASVLPDDQQGDDTTAPAVAGKLGKGQRYGRSTRSAALY